MTRQLLQSDIDRAVRLMEENCPDSEIVRALVRRGINSTRAAQVVGALRQGRRVEPDDVPVAYAAKPVGADLENDPAVGAGSERPHRGHSSRRRHSSRERNGARRATKLALASTAILCGAILALVVFSRELKGGSKSLPVAGNTAKPSAGSSAVQLEFRDDGCYLQGHRLAPATLLRSTIAALGAPTRTNSSSAGEPVFIYDLHGLRILTASGSHYMMLDCDKSGETSNPYSGELVIGEDRVSSGTDAKELAGLKSLRLSSPLSDQWLFVSRVGPVELQFAYTSAQDHLSSVQIKLE